MARVKVTVTLEIEVDETALQTAALAVPAQTDPGQELDAPLSATSDPSIAALVWAMGLRNRTLDELPGSEIAYPQAHVTNTP